MKYRNNIPTRDFAKALYLEKSQVKRLHDAIKKAYDQAWDARHGANIDNINAIVAPYIKSQEEAFYAAQVIITDVVGAMQKTGNNFLFETN